MESSKPNNEPTTVYTSRSKTEASIVKGWLEQEGIQARIFDGSDVAGIFDVIDSDPQIIVEREHAERAIEIIRNYQAELQESPDMANVSDAEGQFDWPMCPVCDEMRLTRCDKCNTIGNEFSTDETEDSEHILCLSCHEATTLVFVDKCKFCEHDFTGSTPVRVSLADADSTNTSRAMLLTGGLILVIAILAIWYFTTK